MPRRFALLLLLLIPAVGTSADPLHLRLDAVIDAAAKTNGVPLSGPADDAEFLRRAWLDFAGRIPTSAEARAFLNDTSADKRTKLIDTLLAKPEYATHFAHRFHLMLMERLGDHPEWTKYLEASFKANTSWDVLVRDMLKAEPSHGATFWMAKRLENYGQQPVDYSALTRDVGRLFLGKNLQCCECHDHLTVNEYKQAHFQGLHAFFRNTSLIDLKALWVGEKPTTAKASFASVFEMKEMTTGPALPGGAMVDIPTFPKGQEFATPPDRKTNNPGVPKFSTLASVAEKLPAADNKDFARNIANRLWFLLLGRGLVHPLDFHHAGNPASHPEALELLTDELVKAKFDMKFVLREVALTRAYGRSSRLPKGVEKPAEAQHFTTAIEKRLSGETALAMVTTATGVTPTDALKAKFLKTYANQPREPEEEVLPSLRAALFLRNDETLLALLKPAPGNLVSRLAEMPAEQIADELYLSVLTRLPTAAETSTVAKVLAKHTSDKPAAVGKLAWALLASSEFGVNH
jgi:hypothetical protein